MLALVADRLVGEPPDRLHPVALFGRLVEPLDRPWRLPRLTGVAIALVLPLAAAGTAWAVVVLFGRATAAVSPPLATYGGAVAAGLVLATTTSLRMLLSEAAVVVDTAGSDVTAARRRLPALVGRDPSDLSAGHVRSAAVESAAENLADGLVGPLLAFAVLSIVSLPVAAAGAAWVKAVNTLDAMLGYRDRPHGMASARLDDLVMWFPARITAVLLAAVGRDPDALVQAKKWAANPPSWNAGWPMATMAGLLHVRLEKPGVYTLNGVAELPDTAAARRGIRAVRIAGLVAFLGTAGVVAWS